MLTWIINFSLKNRHEPLTRQNGLPENNPFVIEFNPAKCVETGVLRFRSIIASLLPGFWLVVLVLCPIASLGQFAPKPCCSPLHTAEETAPAPAKPCCSHDDSARCQGRRNGGDRAEVAPNLLEPVATCISIPLCISAPVTRLAGDAFLLPQRWQFVWRTAAEPRAPSILS